MLTTRAVTLDGAGNGSIGSLPARLAGVVCPGSFTVTSLGQEAAAGTDSRFFLAPEMPVVADLEIAGDPGATATFLLDLGS